MELWCKASGDDLIQEALMTTSNGDEQAAKLWARRGVEWELSAVVTSTAAAPAL
jgi:hypothetical protein